MWGSALAWIVFVPIYCSIYPIVKYFSEIYGVHHALYQSWVFWFGLPLIAGICILRTFSWK